MGLLGVEGREEGCEGSTRGEGVTLEGMTVSDRVEVGTSKGGGGDGVDALQSVNQD